MNIGIESNILRGLLKNCCFINGTAYAGKSTMVKLLAERHDGIVCGENYHEKLMTFIDREHQPNLSYFDTMSGWQEFLSRTPEAYDAWIRGCSSEAAGLEIAELIRRSESGKLVFVDTNISAEILHEISSYERVAIMLNEQSMSVERFFERGDPEKQFLLRKIGESDDPEWTMQNFKNCIAAVNSQANYDEFMRCGFKTFVRDESVTIDAMLENLEKHFGLN